jgi:hypothetical protein
MSRSTTAARLRTALALSAVAALAACSDAPVTSSTMETPDSGAYARAAADEPVVAGEVIVKLRDGESLDALASTHGVRKGAQG